MLDNTTYKLIRAIQHEIRLLSATIECNGVRNKLTVQVQIANKIKEIKAIREAIKQGKL